MQALRIQRAALALAAVVTTVAPFGTSSVRAQAGNAPPVIDAASAYWERDETVPTQWKLWHVARVHDADSRRIYVRVLVLDKTGNLISDSQLGTDPDEENTPLDNIGWGASTPGTVGTVTFTVSDSDGNELEPITIAVADPDSDTAPTVRSVRLNRSAQRLTLVGKRLARIVCVELNGTRVPAASLTVSATKKKVTFQNAAATLGLVDGWNTIRIEMSNGNTNSIIVRK